MQLSERIVAWLKDKVKDSGREGIVLGLSGGIDSAVVGVLARAAVRDRSLALIMPCQSHPADERDALLVAQHFGLTTEKVDLTPVYEMLLAILPPGKEMAGANLKPRLRMMTLYYYANNHNYLVAGTGNKSELTVGYFTKYGDGGVDVLPLGGLVKTQVRDLAREIGMPNEIIERAPSAGLWEGQTDEGEMGMTYEDLDKTILCVEAGDPARCNQETLKKVRGLYRTSAHKRAVTEIFYPDGQKTLNL